jgi:hypothetical protein
MCKDVDQPPERVADIEATRTPRLGHRSIRDDEAARHGTPMNLVAIVDLDGKIGDGRSLIRLR